MSGENDLTIRLKALDGRWETVGADRLRGIVPESFQATANDWGSDTCSFVLRRATGAIHPDLSAFTPCRVEVAGVKVWSGRVKETPTQDGTDEAISVQGEGMQYHLDDDVYDRVYVKTRLGDWRDGRSFVTAPLGNASGSQLAAGVATVGDGVITLLIPAGTALIGTTRVGVILDMGSTSTASRFVVEWESSNNDASATANFVLASNAQLQGVTPQVAFAMNTGASGTATGSSGGSRYVWIYLASSVAHTPASDVWLRITSAKIFADSAYESGNASVLTADDVVNDALDRATLLLSSDRSQVQPGTVVVDEYAPSGARSPREAISSINAYENYETKVDVDDRVCFRPRPAAPAYEIGEWSGADFSDASTNSGEDIFNRVLVEGTGPDGAPLSVDRSAADQVGAVLVPVTTPAITNPSFAVDTSGWSLATGSATISRTTTAGEYDTAPAAMKIALTTAGSVVGTTTGTFLKGQRYTLRFRFAASSVSFTNAASIKFGEGSDAVERKFLFTFPMSWSDGSVTWVPTSDRTSVTIMLIFEPTSAVNYFFDSFGLYVTVPTLVDRRNFQRTKILPINSSITTAVGTRIADLYLAAHKMTPFRGGFKVTGRGGVRRVIGGGSVHPAWLLRDTGQLIRCSHRADPDTGAWARSGAIATVSYDHDSQTATVALDEDREGFETLLSRFALVSSQGPA